MRLQVVSKQLDPFDLAAYYCDRFVNVRPFRDGNGRMCRLIPNCGGPDHVQKASVLE
ncbi:hypothetical protein GGR56DRAFT_650010 [Xylariaceae sp. FL0804]|nr:hypothetical protein GGR56DRAFT_650010 [Xylariaceae sp. FL0804]